MTRHRQPLAKPWPWQDTGSLWPNPDHNKTHRGLDKDSPQHRDSASRASVPQHQPQSPPHHKHAIIIIIIIIITTATMHINSNTVTDETPLTNYPSEYAWRNNSSTANYVRTHNEGTPRSWPDQHCGPYSLITITTAEVCPQSQTSRYCCPFFYLHTHTHTWDHNASCGVVE